MAEGRNSTTKSINFPSFHLISNQILAETKTRIVWPLRCPTVTQTALNSLFLVMSGRGWGLPGRNVREAVPVLDGRWDSDATHKGLSTLESSI